MSSLIDTAGLTTTSSSSTFQDSNEAVPTCSTNGRNRSGILKTLSQAETEVNQYNFSDNNTTRNLLSFRNGPDENANSDEAFKSAHVQFSKITFREHPILPSDNPSVTEGPPVGLEWDHQLEYSIDIDQYENRKMPRRPSQLKIPSDMRTSMLKEFGHSWTTINEATKQAKRDRKLRVITMKRSDMNRIAFDEKLEAFGRRFKTPFRKRSSKSTNDTSHLRESTDAAPKDSKIRTKAFNALSRKLDPLDVSATGSANKINLDSHVLDDSRDTVISVESKEEPVSVTKMKSKPFLCNSIEIYE